MAERTGHINERHRRHGRTAEPQEHQYRPSQAQPSAILSPGLIFEQQFTDPTSLNYQDSEVDMLMQDIHTSDTFWLGMHQNSKEESVTSATTSFVKVSTPSAIADGSQSYGMINERRYSGNSNEISGNGSNSPSYSTLEFGQNEWLNGSEFAVDTESMAEDTQLNDTITPQDQRLVLGTMWSPEPRTVYDPYKQLDSASCEDHSMYQNMCENYTTKPMQQYMYARPITDAKLNDVFAGPWSPMDPQVPIYPPGFVAFAPSPGPAGEQAVEDDSSNAPSASQSPHASKSKAVLNQSRSSRTPSKGNEKASCYSWENLVIDKNGLQRLNQQIDEQAQYRSGCRKGELSPDKREKAKRIRKLKACWDCWIQKTPCSEGETCERCIKVFSPSSHQVCSRAGFKDYEPTFFPEYLHAHLKKREIEALLTDNTNGFTNVSIDVEISAGLIFKPMRLRAHIFNPKTWILLRQARLASETGDLNTQLLQRYSPPVGLLGLNLADLKKKCTKHVERMVENPEYVGQTTAGDITQLPKTILEIVHDYYKTKKLPLVREALQLHAMHYFMSSLLTFIDETATEIYQAVWTTESPSAPRPAQFLSSRMLSRQVKYAMNKKHRELTETVLEGLERSMRSRTKESWAPSFCTILILCLCMEGLQTAADTLIVSDMQLKGTDSQYNRNQSSEACFNLEEFPFYQCKRLFHDIYKSRREGNGAGREAGFNPLKAIGEGAGTGLDDETDAMLYRMSSLYFRSWPEIHALSSRQPMIDPVGGVDPKDIKENNCGRLASKFLRSFFDSSQD